MPKFLVKKWQAGEDTWGDSFCWQKEDIVLEAPSAEIAEKFVGLVHGAGIYAGEALNLKLIGPYSGEKKGRSMLDLLQTYPMGANTKLHGKEFDEFYRRWNIVSGGNMDSALKYFLECKAPELISHVFSGV